MNTSDKITESALRLFWRQGFHATGVEQLSKEAGVTKKTLYSYFPSKESLIGAVLELRDKQFMANMQKSVEAEKSELRPLAYIEFVSGWIQEANFNGCTFINAAAEYANQKDPPHVMAKVHKQRVLTYLEEVCTSAGIKQPALAARQLFLLGEGLIVASQVNGAQADMINAARMSALLIVSVELA